MFQERPKNPIFHFFRIEVSFHFGVLPTNLHSISVSPTTKFHSILVSLTPYLQSIWMSLTTALIGPGRACTVHPIQFTLINSCQGYPNGLKFGCCGHKNGMQFGWQGHWNGMQFGLLGTQKFKCLSMRAHHRLGSKSVPDSVNKHWSCMRTALT